MLKQNIWYVLVGVILIGVFISLLRAMIKWVFVFLIIIGVSFVLINDYKLKISDEIESNLKNIENSFLHDLKMEQKYLVYFDEANGGFTLKSDRIIVYGYLDSKKVNVIYKGEKYVFDKSPVIENIINSKRKEYLKFRYEN